MLSLLSVSMDLSISVRVKVSNITNLWRMKRWALFNSIYYINNIYLLSSIVY